MTCKSGLLLSLVLLFLSACGAQPPAQSGASSGETPTVTASEVLAAYDDACEAYDWFNLATMPCTGDAAAVAGREYRMVDQPGFTTLSDLSAHLKTLFSDDLTDRLLSEGTYREIDGKLYCAEGGRGFNLYLLDKRAEAVRSEDGTWKVTVTFYAWDDFNPPQLTAGLSQRVLTYEYKDGRWCFPDFCPSDDLDLKADTVFTFSYDADTFHSTDFADYTDLQLCCYLLKADGAYSEAPGDLLFQRFLEAPEAMMATLAQLCSAWQTRVAPIIGYNGVYRLTPPEQESFKDLVDSYSPKNEEERAVLDLIADAYAQAAIASAASNAA
ncbi:IseA DL-endopeptidase inhibitor family protein [Oscillibacter sp. MSJ-2]|uniref:IseA DL-endopeptidase inhibitor family protein n=1 Tax=Dysosmobacter acutus TaxID=2841504 RepID=A0ABS6F9X9_9FIRM|nr:IseA DL-endopeptidase inhibitor family protein [Dysosmobacter acutus]MBU5626982.1 IseA DL-endopeptidase inhibitor family protein [Dysosmobacter acutus]